MLLTEAQEKKLCDKAVAEVSALSYKQVKAVAHRAGVHHNTLHYWKIGRHRPKVEMAKDILATLKIMREEANAYIRDNLPDSIDSGTGDC